MQSCGVVPGGTKRTRRKRSNQVQMRLLHGGTMRGVGHTQGCHSYFFLAFTPPWLFAVPLFYSYPYDKSPPPLRPFAPVWSEIPVRYYCRDISGDPGTRRVLYWCDIFGHFVSLRLVPLVDSCRNFFFYISSPVQLQPNCPDSCAQKKADLESTFVVMYTLWCLSLIAFYVAWL